MPTFYDKFIECCERRPQNVAVEIQRPDGLESFTYTELRRMAESFASWLVAQGMPPGSRVAILADNHPRWVAAYLGIIAAGGVTVPLDTAYHADQVAKLLKDSGADLLVCDSKHLETAQEAVDGTEVELVPTENEGRAGAPVAPKPCEQGQPGTAVQPVADFAAIFAAQRGEFKSVPRELDDLASLLYTSGTTADPKGIEVSADLWVKA